MFEKRPAAASCHRIVTKPQRPSDGALISGGQTVLVTPVVFESCHSTWVFDTEHMRFRRILRGIEVHDQSVVTGWRPYFGLEVSDESEAFTVFLNPGRSRMIRSWRHTGNCTQCGGHATAEVSLDDIAAAMT